MKVANALAVLLLVFCTANVSAQQAKSEIKQHEQEVKDIIKFLEYILNTLGSSESSARDKDVLVTESYTKIFRDGKVQVEDDLVEKRNVITNKDVQAYLKDVDFFFQDVKFEFNIKDIKGSVNSNGKLFYKVSIVRNMRGTTMEGRVVNSTMPRFVEINYDQNAKDLKIVSIYTKEFDERTSLLTWWNSLSYEWQSFFKKRINVVSDTMDITDIQSVMDVESIDLSQNHLVQNIEPLTALVNLQVLNISHTPIVDLSPLRNLTGLIELNASYTNIEDATALRYSDNMTKLNLSFTKVADLSFVERMMHLEQLEIRGTRITDFTMLENLTTLKMLDVAGTGIQGVNPITKLSNLSELNISGTMVEDLNPISGLKQLRTLYLDSSRVVQLTPLKGLENLEKLSVNWTQVGDLTALVPLKKLQRVYCDHTLIQKDVAESFMAANPQVLVIYDSEDMRGWWNALPEPWKAAFIKTAAIGQNPTNEELARIPNLDSLNVSGVTAIKDLEPLRNVPRLRSLKLDKTSVTDLSPIRDQRLLTVLDISDTKVNNIDVVSNFTKLGLLRADRTGVNNISALSNVGTVKKVFLDGTSISDSVVQEFLHRQPKCLVVFKTDTLVRWWKDLPGAWKEVLNEAVNITEGNQKEDLHRLVEGEVVRVKDAAVSNLSVLQEFVRLKELDLSGTSISDLSPLIKIPTLRVLKATNSPIKNLEPLRSMAQLTSLDISNTPVEDLRPIKGLQQLKSFSCSGTQVSSLSALEELSNLESLDCSNTGVKKIDPLSALPLKSLKCYNTKVTGKAVDKFRESNPNCKVVHY
ncbi:leucine-rich repeat domain-containing protein [Chryseolinea sp. T2]|uniref:leucine-rich repeat domain-containing protein n=1 Tax=Chryseolinea sp. T2 TaxID=3129255 RepID=UPI003077643B